MMIFNAEIVCPKCGSENLVFVSKTDDLNKEWCAEPISPASITVTDGDTIVVGGRKPGVRLVGFNTPEIRNAECEQEARLGVKATNRLRELVMDGDLDFSLVGLFVDPLGRPAPSRLPPKGWRFHLSAGRHRVQRLRVRGVNEIWYPN